VIRRLGLTGLGWWGFLLVAVALVWAAVAAGAWVAVKVVGL